MNGTNEVRYCECCGRRIDDSGICPDGERWYCSESCAIAYNWRKCEVCGNLTRSHMVDGHTYCSRECAISDGCEECAECGRLVHPTGHGFRIAELAYCSGECAARAGFDLAQCEDCGRWDFRNHMFSPDGERWYCSEACALRHHWHKCDHCGEWVYRRDRFLVGYRRVYCSEACAIADGCHRCDVCGTYMYPGQDGGIEYDDHYYCSEGCARRDGNARCQDCGERFDPDTMVLIEDYGLVCRDCFEYGDYGRCDHCGDWYHADDLHYSEFRNAEYCPYCRDEIDTADYIHEYGHRPIPVFHGSGPLYMGIELETDNYSGITSEFSQRLYEMDPAERFYYQKADCSLDDGIEIVSHPMTLNEHASFIWADVLETAKDCGFRSHDAGTCGLHVHVSRAFAGSYEDAENWSMRVWAIVQNNRDALARFSRRTVSQLEHWAKFDNPADVANVKTAAPVDKFGIWATSTAGAKRDRYCAVNFKNGRTIEFRLFRGTLNYTTLLATLALVDGIARYAKAYGPEACEACPFSRLVHWTACTCASPKAARALLEYCKGRDLV